MVHQRNQLAETGVTQTGMGPRAEREAEAGRGPRYDFTMGGLPQTLPEKLWRRRESSRAARSPGSGRSAVDPMT